MMGGFWKMASVCPGGVNPNNKTVMINSPPGRTWGGGGLMKTFHRTEICGILPVHTCMFACRSCSHHLHH